MKIIADENMPLVDTLFSPFGEVVQLPGRQITATQMADADVLLVRSVTEINEPLLQNSCVKFIGSATIGTNHVDLPLLASKGIQFANAPGCNASAVVHYVLSALSVVEPQWQQKTVGIVGCGNVGGRLYRLLTALGVTCRCYDPFLSPADIPHLASFDEVITSDILCLHTPLTTEGEYPTYHLFDASVLQTLSDNTVLLNAGRGDVVDNHALCDAIDTHNLRVVLDVWSNEPQISLPLLDKVLLGTPHIAGYSQRGKREGTNMVYQAFCRWLGVTPSALSGNTDVILDLPLPSAFDVLLTQSAKDELLNQLILSAYDIRKDDASFRQSIESTREAVCDNGVSVAKQFDKLRKEYPQRLEFADYRLPSAVAAGMSQRILSQSLLLGFTE